MDKVEKAMVEAIVELNGRADYWRRVMKKGKHVFKLF